MHNARTDFAGGPGNGLSAFGLNRVKALSAALGENANQVHDDAGAAGGCLNRRRVADIGLNGVNLADFSQRLEVSGQFRAADAHPDAVIALGERANHVPAEETRSSEDGDERIDGRWHGAIPQVITAERGHISRFGDMPAFSR